MSSSDRDIVFLAGKAMNFQENSGFMAWWRPLEDEGAALRLACRLRLDIAWKHESGYVEVFPANKESFPIIRELFVGKVNSAVCRAIVRAAAEIGKTMP